jgi:hypothetical protein
MLAAAALLSLLAAPGVTVELRGVPECFRAASLEATLRSKVGSQPGRVSVEGSPAGLIVSLERQGYARTSRTLAFRPDECAELPQTVALLVLSWWKVTTPLPPPAAPPAPPAGTPAPTPAPVDRAPDSTAVSAPTVTGEREKPTAARPDPSAINAVTVTAADRTKPAVAHVSAVSAATATSADRVPLAAASSPTDSLAARVAPALVSASTRRTRDAQPAERASAPVAEPPAPPRPSAAPLTVAEAEKTEPSPPEQPQPQQSAAAEVEKQAPPEMPSATRWFISTTLFGSGAFDGDFTGSGRLALEAGLANGLGAVLDAGLESSRGAPLNNVNGQVHVWLGWASLLARYRFDSEAWALTLGLGARVFRVEGSGQGAGVIDPSTQSTYVPAAAASVDLQLQMVAGLFVSLSLQGFVRFWAQVVEIKGYTQTPPPYTVQQPGASVGLGLGYRFR